MEKSKWVKTLPQDIWSLVINDLYKANDISTLGKVSRLNQTFFKATENVLNLLKKEHLLHILQTSKNAFCELFSNFYLKEQDIISLQPKFRDVFNYLADLEQYQCQAFLIAQEILKACRQGHFHPSYEEGIKDKICNFLIPLLKNKFILAGDFGFSFFIGLKKEIWDTKQLHQSIIKSMVLKDFYLNALEGNIYSPEVNAKILFEISIINQLHRVLSEDLFSLTDKTDFITHENKVIYIQGKLFDNFYKDKYSNLLDVCNSLKLNRKEIKIDSLKELKKKAAQLHGEILDKLTDFLEKKEPIYKEQSHNVKSKCLMQ